MRRHVVSGLLALLVAACGQAETTAKDITGTWTSDAARSRDDFIKHLDRLIESAVESEKPAFVLRKEEVLASNVDTFRIKLSFAEDKTYEARSLVDGSPSVATGTWKKVQGTWRLTQTHQDGAALDRPATVVLRMEDGELVGGLVPEHTFHFRRD